MRKQCLPKLPNQEWRLNRVDFVRLDERQRNGVNLYQAVFVDRNKYKPDRPGTYPKKARETMPWWGRRH